MADVTRGQLDASNTQKIKGPGKVSKNRHYQHNEVIANYVDTEVSKVKRTMPFRLQAILDGGSYILKDERLVGIEVATIIGGGSTLEEGTTFTKLIENDFIGQMSPNENLPLALANVKYQIIPDNQ